MRLWYNLCRFAAVACLSSPAGAVEGPAVAGPIGGTDMRSAQLPPPGAYGGIVGVAAGTRDFVDGNRKTIPALREAHLTRNLAAAFVYFVPDVKIFGGSIAAGALLPVGNSCGSLFVGEADQCADAMGDPYAEFAWSRFFGTVRPSAYPGAYPIAQGLTVLAGVGFVIPAGNYDHSSLLTRAVSIGTNIWDVAPTIAITLMSPPILAEGTELSAKAYWNNYRENPDTGYRTGDLVNVDFALTERIGRFQVGIAGFYGAQVESDRLDGLRVPPDGVKGETLQLGGVVNYDMPEHASSLKLKATTSIYSENTVTFWAVALGWVKKF